jgi:hypothetical protein
LSLLAIALILSCEDRTTSDSISVSTLGVPSSGGEGTRNPAIPEAEQTLCDRSRNERADEAFTKAYGYGAAEFASRMAGEFSTNLRWSPLTSSFPSEFRQQEEMAVAVAYNGDATIFPHCDNLVELGVMVSLSSQNGALRLATPGVLSSRGQDKFQITADIALDSLDELTAQLASTGVKTPTAYRLELRKAEGELAGQLSVQGPGGAACNIASWPDSRVCKLRERPMSRDITYLGMNGANLDERLASDVQARVIRWEDSGEVTRMQVEFSPSGETACVLGSADEANAAASVKRVVYGIPGDIHIRTDDGRANIIVPGRASVLWTKGEWGPLEFSTNGLAVAGPGTELRPLDLEQLPATHHVILAFSPTVERVSRVTGRARMLGGLEVYTLDTLLPGASLAGASCLANGFLGALAEVTHTTYLQ